METQLAYDSTNSGLDLLFKEQLVTDSNVALKVRIDLSTSICHVHFRYDDVVTLNCWRIAMRNRTVQLFAVCLQCPAMLPCRPAHVLPLSLSDFAACTGKWCI